MKFKRIALMLAAASLVAHAQATTRYVDVANGNDQGGANNCQDPATPCQSIGHALDVAFGGDEIRIAAGLYIEALVIERSLTLRGAGRNETVIAAHSQAASSTQRVITIDGMLDVSIGDLSIAHGNATGAAQEEQLGGGLFFEGSSLELTRVNFVSNRADTFGGGMYSRGDLTLTDVGFGANQAHWGGGMYVRGDAVFRRVVVDNNSATQQGGGMYGFLARSDMIDVTFTRNSAGTAGGGIYNTGVEKVSHGPAVINAVFLGNTAVAGGGIYLINGSNAVLTNVSFSGNSVTGDGGGVFSTASTLEIRNSIFWNNENGNGVGEPGSSVSVLSGPSTVVHSMAQGCNPGGMWDFSACGADGGGNLADVDPLFVLTPDPEQAAAVSGDLRLQQESSAVDAGSNEYVEDIDFDLDGHPRIFNGTVDLGTYEWQPPANGIFHDRFEG